MQINANTEYCMLLEDSKDITSNEFKVNIPRIMPKIPIEAPKSKDEPIQKSRILNKKSKVSDNITIQNFILAKSATSLRASHLGDAEMKSSEGITLTETVNKMPIELSHSRKGGGPHPPHEHMIKDPHKFYDMKYFKLNNIKIKKGHKMIGTFVSDSFNDFWITYITDVIPRR